MENWDYVKYIVVNTIAKFVQRDGAMKTTERRC